MEMGKLIVFEGADAAGKSSICESFCSYLKAENKNVILKSFPGKDTGTLGALVYDIHHYQSRYGIDKITPLSLQALHIAAHLDAIESSIVPLLKRGQTIILDRFWWSTKIYGMVAGADAGVLNKLIEAEKLAWGACKPDMIFYISRGTPLRDEPLDVWSLLTEGYERLAADEAELNTVCKIENESTLGEALSKVVDRCRPML